MIQGEQINLTYKLYSRVSLLDVSTDKASNLVGFWGEEVERPKDIPPTVETVNGKQYRVYTIKLMALFPTQSGTLEITPMGLKATVQVQSRRSLDPFDSFFSNPFGRSAVVDVKSGGVKIKVPKNWQVVSEGAGIIGGFENHAAGTSGSTRLTVTGAAIFGGVEIIS